MTKIKLCGITRMCDIEVVNKLKPEYIGFVFAKKSKRFVAYDMAKELKGSLSKEIETVGVFVDEAVDVVAALLEDGTIEIAQLHGNEDEEYISKLRKLSSKPIIKAFRIESEKYIENIMSCSADYVLLDSGAGSGECFEWSLINNISRPFFLAGGLNVENVEKAVKDIQPFAVDVSSGIETEGLKDEEKMTDFVTKVRACIYQRGARL